jgi:hypothetical protein
MKVEVNLHYGLRAWIHTTIGSVLRDEDGVPPALRCSMVEPLLVVCCAPSPVGAREQDNEHKACQFTVVQFLDISGLRSQFPSRGQGLSSGGRGRAAHFCGSGDGGGGPTRLRPLLGLMRTRRLSTSIAHCHKLLELIY